VDAPPRGLSFGRAAADYERGRPDCSDAAVDRLCEALGLDASSEVVDLAAGTGKLTRALVRRFARVTAVEPDPSMRALLAVEVPDCYRVLEGLAEAIPLADGSADAVFVADAFHWFATDAAVAEIRRVLRPQGGLAVLRSPWSRDCFDPPIPEALLDELDAAYRRAEAGTSWGPRYGTDEWAELFERGGFEPPHRESLPQELTLTSGQAASLWLSVSSVTMLPREEHDALAAKLRAGLAGDYRLRFETELFSARLTT